MDSVGRPPPGLGAGDGALDGALLTGCNGLRSSRSTSLRASWTASYAFRSGAVVSGTGGLLLCEAGGAAAAAGPVLGLAEGAVTVEGAVADVGPDIEPAEGAVVVVGAVPGAEGDPTCA